jgi:fermentation-respiration switch protein FrsA (DUF1100 family)
MFGHLKDNSESAARGVAADAYCPPEVARRLSERIKAPKNLVWVDTASHIDLYDNPSGVAPAVDAVAAWFDRYLP